MIPLLTVLLLGASAILTIPVGFLFLQVLASLQVTEEPRLDNGDNSFQVAVVVPAHNEGSGLVPTIRDIRPQLGARDRLIVVADNCSDDTAAVAAAEGCEVLVRDDPGRIGKGYALAWAIDSLKLAPPDLVVFIDADCRIQSDMIARLAQACNQLKRPLQACFLMKQAENSPIDHSWAEFAWIIKNWVRPLGLTNLQLPVQLMGTGMIFPWEQIQAVPLSSGNLVEDMKLGLDLAAIGSAPLFFPFVVGTSEFPQTEKGTESQRLRWVQGHIGIIGAVPKLLLRALFNRNPALLVLLLDLAIPPLSLLGLLLALSVVLDLGAALTLRVSTGPVFVAFANSFMFTASIALAWLKFGRDIISPAKFLLLGPLAIKKVVLYFGMMVGRTASSWIRTDRAKHGPK